METELVKLISSLVENSVFGDVGYVELKPEEQDDIGAQFASTLSFVNLTVESAAGKEQIPLVVKLQIEGYEVYEQFYNELLMYKEIIPTLGFDEQSYPKMYYGRVTKTYSKMNVLIFENLKFKNYLISKQSPFLDFEHIELAMKKIAKFHSLSYILKHEDESKFFEIIKKLKDKDFFDENTLRYEKKHFAAIERGVKAFLKSHVADEVFGHFLDALKCTTVVWRKLCAPEGQFGVICHGDFCNNNIMYKYNGSGSPTDCVLLDFQRSQYGSPAVELAFYLYLHTTEDTRKKHWDDFLKTYWDTLRESVPDQVNVPPWEEFIEHFAGRAVYGYLVSSFFLPIMIDRSAKFWYDLPEDEEMEISRTMGGEQAEGKLADIVSHLYHKKYIHSFLDFAKTHVLVR